MKMRSGGRRKKVPFWVVPVVTELIGLTCACSFRADAFDPFTGLECGYEQTDTIELPASQGCWTVSEVDQCIPTTQSPCQGPQRPIWKPGTKLTLWCPVGEPPGGTAKPEKVECGE